MLLAAGQGKRLGVDEPKCLIRVAGQSLLERHLGNLAAAGIKHLTVVVGHAHERLTAELDRLIASGATDGLGAAPLLNELYQHGSIVSLQRAAAQLECGAIWMDADVLYPASLLKRLACSSHENCALLDPRSTEQGEEMMLGVQGGRVRRIGRRVGDGWDVVGESVGFFKVGAAGGAVMKRILDSEIAAGRLDQEHEEALNKALDEVPFGFEPVGDIPWTEIDFPEDVAKAEKLAAPIAELG